MRITIYKIELNNDLHTKLVKEKAYNHDVKNLNNPSSIVQVMNDVFHMNKLMENKTYKVFVNPFYGYDRVEDIEVKKKSDIVDYVEYLKLNGFKEVERI